MSETKEYVMDRVEFDSFLKQWQMLREADVVQLTGLTKYQVRYRSKKGSFPRSFKLTPTSCVRWLKSEVDQWIAEAA